MSRRLTARRSEISSPAGTSSGRGATRSTQLADVGSAPSSQYDSGTWPASGGDELMGGELDASRWSTTCLLPALWFAIRRVCSSRIRPKSIPVPCSKSTVTGPA